MEMLTNLKMHFQETNKCQTTLLDYFEHYVPNALENV